MPQERLMAGPPGRNWQQSISNHYHAGLLNVFTVDGISVSRSNSAARRIVLTIRRSNGAFGLTGWGIPLQTLSSAGTSRRGPPRSCTPRIGLNPLNDHLFSNEADGVRF
jgi:hypothetical protein